MVTINPKKRHDELEQRRKDSYGRKYESRNVFVGKVDLADICNEMDDLGYDFVFSVQQAGDALVNLMFKRRDDG